MRYDLELDCAFTAFVWGVWVSVFRPISASATVSSVRGLRLCHEVFAWAPIPSDYIWGALTAIPAFIQILYINRPEKLRIRSATMMISSGAFLLFTLLLGMENPKTTGVPMYSALALAQLVCVAQISRKQHCGIYE